MHRPGGKEGEGWCVCGGMRIITTFTQHGGSRVKLRALVEFYPLAGVLFCQQKHVCLYCQNTKSLWIWWSIITYFQIWFCIPGVSAGWEDVYTFACKQGVRSHPRTDGGYEIGRSNISSGDLYFRKSLTQETRM